MSLQWTGKLRGSFTAPASARWCPADSLLEVIASRADTSAGLAIIARDTLRAEVYGVNETQNYTPGRPQASVSLRMLGDMALLGYDGMGGQVTVSHADGRIVSGSLDVKLRPVSGGDTLQLRGSFSQVPVTRATGVCGRANKPAAG